MKPVRLAILGLGTVGGGALKLLKENAAEIRRRTGREIEITYVGTRRPRPDLNLPESVKQSSDLMDIVRQPDVDVVVEVMGGIHPAYDVIMEAMKHGKQVVTANKALLAEHVMSCLKRLKIMPYKLPMKLRLRVAFQSLKSSVKV